MDKFQHILQKQQEKLAWERAKSIDTDIAYWDFIEDYPESEYIERAKKALSIFEEENWEKARQQNSLESYREFLLKHPDSKYDNEAGVIIAQLNDDLNWKNVEAENDVWAYSHYVVNHPGGQYVDQAKQRLVVLQEEDVWQKAQLKHTVDSYKNYCKIYREGKYLEEAKQLIHLMEIESEEEHLWLRLNARPVSSYMRTYLEKFPFGKYSDEVRKLLKIAEAKENREKATWEEIQRQVKEKENALWSKAMNENTVEAYSSYIEKYPNGMYVKKAKQTIKNMKPNLKSGLEVSEQHDQQHRLLAITASVIAFATIIFSFFSFLTIFSGIFAFGLAGYAAWKSRHSDKVRELALFAMLMSFFSISIAIWMYLVDG